MTATGSNEDGCKGGMMEQRGRERDEEEREEGMREERVLRGGRGQWKEVVKKEEGEMK